MTRLKKAALAAAVAVAVGVPGIGMAQTRGETGWYAGAHIGQPDVRVRPCVARVDAALDRRQAPLGRVVVRVGMGVEGAHFETEYQQRRRIAQVRGATESDRATESLRCRRDGGDLAT